MVLGFNLGNRLGKNMAGITSIGDTVDNATDTIGRVSPIDLDKTIGDTVENFTGNKDLGDRFRDAGNTIDNTFEEGEEVINETRDKVIEEGRETYEEVKDKVNDGTGGLIDTGRDVGEGLGRSVEYVINRTREIADNPVDAGDSTKSFLKENKTEIILSGIGVVLAFILNQKLGDL